MNKFKYIYFSSFIFITFFTTISFGQQSYYNYIIATGSKGGNYNKIGKFIAEQYADSTKNIIFSCMESNGSIENLELLKSNSVDFAIIQRNELLNNLYDTNKGNKNIEVIAPLFEEKFLIYAHSNNPFNINLIKESKNKIFGFTSARGYSHLLFKRISRFLEIDLSNSKEQFSNYRNLISDFKKDSIDFLVSFSLPIFEIDTLPNVNKLYFNKKQIKLLEERNPNLFETNLLSNNEEYRTLGSWTFLIGDKEAINKLENDGFNFVKNLLKKNQKKSIYTSYLENSFDKFKNNKNWKSKFLKRIPINDNLLEELEYQKDYKSEILFTLSVIMFLILLFYYLMKKNVLSNFYLSGIWYRYKHIIIGVVIIFVLYIFSVDFLIRAEKNFYNDVSIKSQLLNMTYGEIHFWLLIRNLTGIDNGIYPFSDTGKLMISFQIYLFWIGGFIIALLEYLTYKFNKKRKEGKMKLKLTGHTVIFGWTDHTYQFILQAMDAAYKYDKSKQKIVCITEDIKEIHQKYPLLEKLVLKKKLYFISGKSRGKNTLINANIHKAHTVVLLSEGNNTSSDEKTLLRALAISRHCREKAIEDSKKEKDTENKLEYKKHKTAKYVDAIYIIAEINDPQFKNDLLQADVNEVVIASVLAKGTIIQSILHHGVSKVLDEALEFNEYNEFYIIDLAENQNKHLRNRTFDELLLPLRKQKILLIAIIVIYHDENGKIIIDEETINDLLHQEGLDRAVILNPITDIEIKRKTDEDDHLIVFATNKEYLQKHVKKVEFEN